MKLYTNPKSTGNIIAWYTKELGLEDVEMITLNYENQEHKKPEYLKIQPFGRLPALIDGDVTLYESWAILLYLGEKYGGLDTVKKRAQAAQWVLFANTTLADAFFDAKHRDKAVPEVMGTLDQMLSEHDYVQGNALSVGDVAVGATLWCVQMVVPECKLDLFAHIISYMERLQARPALKAVTGGA